eukprot:gb/GFBE01053514.1/.p1 GENE.gb/GFBE01053514.1/~~gb/GFBE01053514.1/.p1  ORF type:complete len:170 (+),score=29.45 gb/GFBE01053514.1/:1-510(+)
MAAQVVEDKRAVFVGGVPKHAEWQELKDHMRTAGEVEYCEVLYSDWGESRGVGYVQFKTEDEAAQAIATLNDSMMDDRKVSVSAWTGKRPRNDGKRVYEMMSWWGGPQKRRKVAPVDPAKAPLVDRIKTYQKADDKQKEAWYAFCGDVKDPARHEISKLEEFIRTHAVP